MATNDENLKALDLESQGGRAETRGPEASRPDRQGRARSQRLAPDAFRFANPGKLRGRISQNPAVPFREPIFGR